MRKKSTERKNENIFNILSEYYLLLRHATQYCADAPYVNYVQAFNNKQKEQLNVALLWSE